MKKLKIIFGVFALASVISYYLIDVNVKQFDQSQWESSTLTRYEMATDIIESNILFGKTKTEVISLLGKAEPSTLIGKDHFTYSLGKPPSFFETSDETLIVIFENDIAIEIIHKHE